MIRREAFHYSVDIALGPIFEGQPGGSGGDGVKETMIPPGMISLFHVINSELPTHINRTRVTAGNSNEHLSGLILQTAAVIGIK